MNRKQLISAIAFAVVGASAFAQEAGSDAWMQATASKSFEQVRAELVQARKDGTIKFGGAGYMEKVASVKSREQVRDEAITARHTGELQAIGGEAHAFAPGAQGTSTVVAGNR
jgi:hypothetical protein